MIKIKSFAIVLGLAFTPALVFAQAPVVVAPAPVAVPATPVVSTTTAAPAKAEAKPSVTSIGTSAPVPGIGQPIEGKIGIQPQVTTLGERALWMHDIILVPMMIIISLFVLGLMLFVAGRFRRKSNPVASKTSHNTLIEIVWTLVPVLVLIGISIPSISLLAAQFKPPTDLTDAKGNVTKVVTLKAIGNQWYWTYEYPDLGVDLTANMLPDAQAKANGEPRLLAVDQRVLLPVNTPIKLLTTGADVIHSWAVPAFWIKLDAVPGRINETSFTVDKEGVYYGQCSELCGDKHGFMPIGVEVVSKEKFAQWVRAKGGHMPGDVTAAVTAGPTTPATIAAPAAAKN
jgi:cytochrome c oxidase subunit II